MDELIDYLEIGTGKTAILLPSLWLTSKSYKSIAQKLSHKFRIIVPDLYRGKSKYSRCATSIDDYVNCLDFFVKKNKLDKFFLIGFSFSGFIAAKYACKFSKKIRKLLLVSTSPIPINIKQKKRAFVLGYMKLFMNNIKSKKGGKKISQWLTDCVPYFLNHSKQAFFDIKMLFQNYDYKIPKLPKSKLIFAKKDEFIPLSEVEKMKNIKNLEIEIIDNYHGWFFIKEDLLVKKAIKFFVKRN